MADLRRRPGRPLSDTEALARNLARYPWLHVGHNALFWLPVFVLYFSSQLDASAVLWLEFAYYLGVVVLEVPSGYASDRWGRRPTLIVGTVAWALGSAVLALGGTLEVFVVGQLLLATGRAFQSGTDSSMLYDTLDVLGRTHEFAEREAQAQSWGFLAMAVASLAGGMAGLIDLRLGHAWTAAAGLIAVVAVLGMVEPPRHAVGASPSTQLGQVLGHVRDPVLRWTLFSSVTLTAWVHVPYELVQPWLEVQLEAQGLRATTPVVSAGVLAVTLLVASLIGRRAPKLSQAIGASATILAAWVVLSASLLAMGAGLGAWALPLVMLRSVPMALARPTLAAEAHPRLDGSLRATWMSLESLSGRLAFSSLLAVGALVTQPSWTNEGIAQLLLPAGGLALGTGLAAWWAAPRALRRRRAPVS